MKIDNKGFAISGMIYTILLLFIMLLFGILALLGGRKVIFDKLKHDIAIKLNNDESVIRNLKTDKSGANKPDLSENMIPIVYDIENNIWVKANNTNEYVQNWYNYNEKIWANAVTVTESSREQYLMADPGIEIKEEDVLTYLVWIPRYKYEIFNDGSNIIIGATDESNIKTINIEFENSVAEKSLGISNGEFLTHPAFTFGDTELSGFWVGKFETGGTIDQILIKPNVSSLRNVKVSDMFISAREIEKDGNIYGVKADEVDTHMMKNSEWGAVAYLSHSQYGINGNIRYNNSNTYITGCAATNEPTTGYITVGYSGCENKYDTATGYLASTTGNISGIYDMSGGAWEYVMGVIQDSSLTNKPLSGNSSSYNSGFNGLYGTSGSHTTGIDFPESKYFDLYAYGDSSNNVAAYSRGILGDATKELGSFAQSTIETDGQTRYISSWYHDYAYFPYSVYPWFHRGGYSQGGADAGIFSYHGTNGNAIGHDSFRVVITSK